MKKVLLVLFSSFIVSKDLISNIVEFNVKLLSF